MKANSNILAGLLFLGALTLTAARAQAQDQPAVKILPTTENGIVKVHYAYATAEPVEVKFYDNEHPLFADVVKVDNKGKGFSKKYDLRNVKTGLCWVEISSSEVTVRYKLTGTRDGKNWVPSLETASYRYPLVASK